MTRRRVPAASVLPGSRPLPTWRESNGPRSAPRWPIGLRFAGRCRLARTAWPTSRRGGTAPPGTHAGASITRHAWAVADESSPQAADAERQLHARGRSAPRYRCRGRARHPGGGGRRRRDREVCKSAAARRRGWDRSSEASVRAAVRLLNWLVRISRGQPDWAEARWFTLRFVPGLVGGASRRRLAARRHG